MNKRIDVVLTDEELEFLKRANKDRLYGDCKNLNELMARMFYLQLREDMETCDDIRES